jgi:hypothetical protein
MVQTVPWRTSITSLCQTWDHLKSRTDKTAQFWAVLCSPINVLSIFMTAVLSQDIATDGPAFSRVKSTDCMTFWSTVPGFASFRHEIEGEFIISLQGTWS